VKADIAMKSRLLLYGVDDFAGGLISRRAAERGFAHIASGKDIARVASLANALSRKTPNLVEPRIFGLGDKMRLAEQFDDVAVVVNCCPRFPDVSTALIDACLATQTHYIDLGMERLEIEMVFARNSEAVRAGISLVPGASFDVCAPDALVSRLATMLPDATHLTLAVSRSPRTISEARALVAACRIDGKRFENGAMVSAKPGDNEIKVDFGDGETSVWLAPWRAESIIAAHRGPYKTVESYETFSPALVRAVVKPGLRRWMFRRGMRINKLERKLSVRGEGPGKRQLGKSSCVVWGEARNAAGLVARARLKTPAAQVYAADAVIIMVRSLMDGRGLPGVRFPAEIGGAALVENIAGVHWSELPDAADVDMQDAPAALVAFS
jgi:short subunit dehydrogenase-like uncharacterized protein